MRQTLVQLTDELVSALDRRAPREGALRSKVVRDPFPKSMLVRRMGGLGPDRLHELCTALAASTDC